MKLGKAERRIAWFDEEVSRKRADKLQMKSAEGFMAVFRRSKQKRKALTNVAYVLRKELSNFPVSFLPERPYNTQITNQKMNFFLIPPDRKTLIFQILQSVKQDLHYTL